MFNYILKFFYPPIKEDKISVNKKINKPKTSKLVKKESTSSVPPNLLEEIIEKKKTLRKVSPKPAYIREDPFASFLKNFRKQINGED